MTYLIAEIWAFLAAAAVLGLIVGAAFVGVSRSGGQRDLRRKLVELEADANTQREEAAKANARLQSWSTADNRSLAETRHLQERTALAEREAEALRGRLVDLEAAAYRARDAEALGEEVERLKAQLAGAPSHASISGDDAVEAARAEAADLRRRLDALQTENDALSARLAASATAAATGAGEAAEPHWLAARNRVLEQKLAELDGRKAPSDAEADVVSLRARIAELEAQGGLGAQSDLADVSEEPTDPARLAWRNRYLMSRVKFLESKLVEADGGEQAAERETALKARVSELEARSRSTAANGSALQDEVARLRARVAELESGGAGKIDLGGDSAAMEWRNRYLTSRVRYLESRLNDNATDGADNGAAAAEEILGLKAKVRELETAIKAAREDRGPKDDGGDYALEWRNRYLTSRVKYLEERLATLQPADAEVDATA